MALRIVTYNVLAPSLGGPSTYTKCNPAFLIASFRLALVKKKLEAEMGRDAVVALQEVELSWVGELHTFFARRGYHFVTANYAITRPTWSWRRSMAPGRPCGTRSTRRLEASRSGQC